MSIEYTEVELDDVLAFFADAYEFDGRTLCRHEAFLDVSKRKVIFRLTTESLDEKSVPISGKFNPSLCCLHCGQMDGGTL